MGDPHTYPLGTLLAVPGPSQRALGHVPCRAPRPLPGGKRYQVANRTQPGPPAASYQRRATRHARPPPGDPPAMMRVYMSAHIPREEIWGLKNGWPDSSGENLGSQKVGFKFLEACWPGYGLLSWWGLAAWLAIAVPTHCLYRLVFTHLSLQACLYRLVFTHCTYRG